MRRHLTDRQGVVFTAAFLPEPHNWQTGSGRIAFGAAWIPATEVGQAKGRVIVRLQQLLNSCRSLSAQQITGGPVLNRCDGRDQVHSEITKWATNHVAVVLFSNLRQPERIRSLERKYPPTWRLRPDGWQTWFAVRQWFHRNSVCRLQESKRVSHLRDLVQALVQPLPVTFRIRRANTRFRNCRDISKESGMKAQGK